MSFDLGSFNERQLSMSHFREWASEIAEGYLGQGALPTTTLTKIAQQEDLTPPNIKTLAAEANKEIHRLKFAAASSGGKYFAADFPLADALQAIASVQVDGGKEKVAREMPLPVMAYSGPDAYALFGVKEEPLDKTASVRGEMRVASGRMELLEQKLGDEVIRREFQKDAAEKLFIKQARELILQNTSNGTERMDQIKVLDQFVKSAGLEIGRKPLAKLAYVLGKEGLLTPLLMKAACARLLKVADMKAPEDLISQNLQAQVVNGNHPLYITLKTYHDHSEALDLSRNRHKLVQDELRILKQKARAL